eukprot:6257766-Pyramimonas_sp.AAC.1
MVSEASLCAVFSFLSDAGCPSGVRSGSLAPLLASLPCVVRPEFGADRATSPRCSSAHGLAVQPLLPLAV